MGSFSIICHIGIVGFLLQACYTDWRRRIIQNHVVLCIVLAIIALFINQFTSGEMTIIKLGQHILTAFILGSFTIYMFQFHGLGGGDVKLYTACGLYAGFTNLSLFLGASSIAGFLLIFFASYTDHFNGSSVSKALPWGIPISIGGCAIAVKALLSF